VFFSVLDGKLSSYSQRFVSFEITLLGGAVLTLMFFRFVRISTFFFAIFFTHYTFSDGNSSSMRPSLLDGLLMSPKVKEISKAKSSPKKYLDGKRESKVVKRVSGASRGFDLDKLPRRYNHWLLDVVKPSHFGGRRCVLRSNITEMEDGYLPMPVVLEVFSDLIKVSGQSPIDLSYNDLGIKIDAFDSVSIDAIVSETNALFFLELPTLIAQMTKGDKLVVVLGFWPVAPVNQAYSAEISLRGFSSGIKKLGECEEKLSKIKI
jgi:hypothetical protein